MGERALLNRVEQLKTLEAQMKDLEKQAEELKQDIKVDMERKGLEKQTAGEYIVRFTTMVSSRFDSKAFREAHSRLYDRYLKKTATRRFSIA